MLNFDTMTNFDEIINKYCCFWCLDFALVDCICMEDVWHANLTCRGHPHVPGNISSFNIICLFQISEKAFRGSRIKIDIEAGAPIIFIPHSSKTSDILVIDLGAMSVHNTFLEAGAEGTISHKRKQAKADSQKPESDSTSQPSKSGVSDTSYFTCQSGLPTGQVPSDSLTQSMMTQSVYGNLEHDSRSSMLESWESSSDTSHASTLMGSANDLNTRSPPSLSSFYTSMGGGSAALSGVSTSSIGAQSPSRTAQPHTRWNICRKIWKILWNTIVIWFSIIFSLRIHCGLKLIFIYFSITHSPTLTHSHSVTHSLKIIIPFWNINELILIFRTNATSPGQTGMVQDSADLTAGLLDENHKCLLDAWSVELTEMDLFSAEWCSREEGEQETSSHDLVFPSYIVKREVCTVTDGYLCGRL